MVAVVLNWNGRDETLACLESLAVSGYRPLTIVAIDNGSDEDIRDMVAERIPHALVIRNRVNRGFAGGMNVGICRATALGADYVLLLNNDTLVEATMVARLVEAAAKRPDAGMVCPLVLYRDNPSVILSAGLRCDLRRGYQGPPIGQGQPDVSQFNATREVDAPTGAAMLVPTAVVAQVGMLDETLFLYGEDVEWAMRMRAAGRRVYVAPSARLWHGLSTSSGGPCSPLSAYYQTRNTFAVCGRHAPLRGPRALIRGADIVLANLWHARRAHSPLINVRAVLAGWRDYLRGRSGPRPPEALLSYSQPRT